VVCFVYLRGGSFGVVGEDRRLLAAGYWVVVGGWVVRMCVLGGSYGRDAFARMAAAPPVLE